MALKHLIMCLLVASVLSGCGPTPEEIKNTVKITCNIVGESQNVDAAVRIREVNLAREKIKAKPFLGTEADIIEAAKFGLCENLVADDPEFGSLIEEQREIAAKEKAEEERIAAELLAKQQAEKERIAAEAREKRLASLRNQMGKIEKAIGVCEKEGVSESSAKLGVFVGCTHEEKDGNYHTFEIGSFTTSFSPIYQRIVDSLELPPRVRDKIDNTSANDGFVEDSYGMVKISWRFNVRSILGSTMEKTAQINLKVN